MFCHDVNWSGFVLFGAAILMLRSAASPALEDRPVATATQVHALSNAKAAAASQAQPKRLPEIVVPAPTSTNRVTAAARFHPDTASRADQVILLVKVRVAPGHYIYALENAGTRDLPTALEVELSKLLRPAGPWMVREPKVKDDGARTFSGEVLFQRRFRVDPQAAAQVWKAPIQLTYQVCNEALCWPPATIALETELNIVKPE